MNKWENMTDDFLKKNYVPDVYQPDIFAIDYKRLQKGGIKLLSFDIDETIASKQKTKPSKRTITLFENLKTEFEIVLLTNNSDKRGADFAEALGVEMYIAKAKKPRTVRFQEIQDHYGTDKDQMAHIGNSIMNDVAGGNAFGIMTCLVRSKRGRVGKLAKIGRKTDSQKIKEELKSRGMWRKHHKYEKGDQYYQLGEEPEYRMSRK